MLQLEALSSWGTITQGADRRLTVLLVCFALVALWNGWQYHRRNLTQLLRVPYQQFQHGVQTP